MRFSKLRKYSNFDSCLWANPDTDPDANPVLSHGSMGDPVGKLMDGEAMEVQCSDGTVLSGTVEARVEYANDRERTSHGIYHLLVDLFGQRFAIRMEDGMLVRRVRDAKPVELPTK